MIYFLLLIIFILIILLIVVSCTKKKINDTIEIKNNKIKKENEELIAINSKLSKEKEQYEKNLFSKRQEYDTAIYEVEKLREVENTLHQSLEKEKEISQNAFSNWAEVLESEYDKKEKDCKQEYEELLNNLNIAYSSKQSAILLEIDKYEKDLDQIKQAKAAAIEAQQKEKQVKEDLSSYCLPINNADLGDIQLLESIKTRLTKPRILSMLIWSTYFQKPMTTLCNNILGTKTITGIYKITNQKTGLCYIGKSISVSDRWKQHAKCGLGIDTPAGNKLYKAMMEDGIYSFSWELLEECPKEQLDEKEKFYIDLYNAYNFGYNSTTRK